MPKERLTTLDRAVTDCIIRLREIDAAEREIHSGNFRLSPWGSRLVDHRDAMQAALEAESLQVEGRLQELLGVA